MSLKQNNTESSDRTTSDPTAEEVNELLDTFDEEKAERRIDVLEDMLDIMNER